MIQILSKDLEIDNLSVYFVLDNLFILGISQSVIAV